MAFMGFSEWVAVKEAIQPAQPPQNAARPAMNTASPVSAEIKKVVADNLAKPKQARSAALMALAKKKQNDPKSTPNDLEAIANAMPDAKP